MTTTQRNQLSKTSFQRAMKAIAQDPSKVINMTLAEFKGLTLAQLRKLNQRRVKGGWKMRKEELYLSLVHYVVDQDEVDFIQENWA